MSQTKIKNKTINWHTPVLLQEVIRILDPKKGDSFLDLTAGYGGHSSEIIESTESESVLVDRDENAVSALKGRFRNDDRVVVMKSDFLSACDELLSLKKSFDMILADLGISSPHLDNASRGFAFKHNGPLDMRMDIGQSKTASTVVNTYPEDEIVRILREYGEEPKAKLLARLIVEARPIETTHQLAELAKKAWPGYSKSHPATRLFQAIRIEVNDELSQLEKSLPLMMKLLNSGGRMAVITFHSLEDRIVKNFFRENSGHRYDAELQLLTKQPVVASKDEIVNNPRSRSAKIRAAQAKIKIKKQEG